jgi:D-alanyl-D-alanine carboxypeptidase/D-alanyl-D-alanine-endopeptidase (penicillin-binding protein 4)
MRSVGSAAEFARTLDSPSESSPSGGASQNGRNGGGEREYERIMRRAVSTFWLRAAGVLLGAGVCIAARPGRANDEADALRDGLQRALTANKPSGVELSAHVVDLASGRTLFEYNADRPLTPASVMKLVVSAAALDQLGAGYRYRTTLAMGRRDLLLVGSGDPTLGDEKLCARRGQKPTALLSSWADALAAAGVRTVPGKLIIDDSIFDETHVHPGWPADQYQEWYEAPIGGLNFAANCFEIAAEPRGDGPPALSTIPPNGLVQIVNKARSGGKGTLVARRARETMQAVVSGNCSAPTRLGPIAATDPGMFFAASLRSALAARGIEIEGPIVRQRVVGRDGTLPAEFRVIAMHESPLADAVARACTDSLGMMAEAMLKTLGATSGQPGSWPNGAAVVARFLRQLGVSDDSFTIDDGSGLSRRNRLSARAVTTVLAYMNRSAGGELLRESLALSGVSGTLRKRLGGPETKGRIRAKTGYIASVRTLAGYVEARDGRRLAFAILYNGARSTAPLTAAQDHACRLMAMWPAPSNASAPAVRPKRK